MDDLISKLSEIRSNYNCFEAGEEPYYHALSESIKILSQRADGDTISRQAAVELAMKYCPDDDGAVQCDGDIRGLLDELENLPPAQPDNQINLCDSCDYLYPECPAKNDDVIFGNGIGNDNICACNKYKPSAQPEITRCKDCKWCDDADGHGMLCKNLESWVVATDYDFGCVCAERR